MERSKNESRPTMMAFSRQAVSNLPNSSIENTLKGVKLRNLQECFSFRGTQDWIVLQVSQKWNGKSETECMGAYIVLKIGICFRNIVLK